MFLNKLKKDEYISIFNRFFDINDITVTFEGESLLTEDILQEITGYSKEDLITRNMKILITKNIGVLRIPD